MVMISSNLPVKNPGPGHITLESLLDSPGLTPSPLSDMMHEQGLDINTMPAMKSVSHSSTPTTPAIHPAVPEHRHIAESTELLPLVNQPTHVLQPPPPPANDRAHEARRRILLRDVCTELFCILRSQDVNGYFLSIPDSRGGKRSRDGIGLIQIETRLMKDEYLTLNDFKSDILHLFTAAQRFYPPDSTSSSESKRLIEVVLDWFASLSEHYVVLLNNAPYSEVKDARRPEMFPRDLTVLNQLPTETALSVLNPDNHGIVSRVERVRSLGEEVKPLRSGSHLLVNGGYREDRRNKIVPYTYLDYGPYYSFAPYYDSGASHCSPEANQLLLGTTWLPSRTAYLLPETDAIESEPDADEITQAINNEMVQSALVVGDHHLAVSLAVAEMEIRSTEKLSAQLEAILPGPEVDDDCVYSMCLANALTRQLRDAASSDGIQQDKRALDKLNQVMSCDLDQDPNDDVVELSLPDSLDTPEELASIAQPTDELADSASDLRSLYCAQYRRLGCVNQTSHSGSTLKPTESETDIAHRLVNRLVNLSKRARPRDLIHPYAVRTALGIKPDSIPFDDECTTTTC